MINPTQAQIEAAAKEINYKIGNMTEWFAREVARAALLATSTQTMPGEPSKDLADWSSLPRDLYVVNAKSHHGVSFDVLTCSVPLALAPEVRYVRADAITPVQEGWKLVPVEPTEGMLEGAITSTWENVMTNIWRQMIAASPLPPTTGEMEP